MTTETRKYLVRKNNLITFLSDNDSEENYDDVVEVKTSEVIHADEGKTFYKTVDGAEIDCGSSIWLFDYRTADEYYEKDAPAETAEPELA